MLGSQIAKSAPCRTLPCRRFSTGFQLRFPEPPLKRRSVWLWDSGFQAEFLLML